MQAGCHILLNIEGGRKFFAWFFAWFLLVARAGGHKSARYNAAMLQIQLTAARVLASVLAGKNLNATLDRAFAAAPDLTPQQRAATREVCFDALRHYGFLRAQFRAPNSLRVSYSRFYARSFRRVNCM